MTQNMRHFRLQTFAAADSEDGLESEEEDEDSPAAIKRRHKRELARAERENRENTSALLELRDLEGEMTILSKLFEAQESIIKSMKTCYSTKDLRDITGNGQAYLEDALEHLDEYKQQAKDMLKRVDTVRKDVCHHVRFVDAWMPERAGSADLSAAVREDARDGTTAGAGGRGTLVKAADRACFKPEPVGHDLYHLHRHLPSAQLLHRAVWGERNRLAGRENAEPQDDRRHLAPDIGVSHHRVTYRGVQLACAVRRQEDLHVLEGRIEEQHVVSGQGRIEVESDGQTEAEIGREEEAEDGAGAQGHGQNI